MVFKQKLFSTHSNIKKKKKTRLFLLINEKLLFLIKEFKCFIHTAKTCTLLSNIFNEIIIIST